MIMSILQKVILFSVLIFFFGIFGWEILNSGKEYHAIKKAKFKKTMRELEKEENQNGKRY